MLSPIKDLRLGKNMKQSELAVALGVSVATISNWERGVYEPDQNSLLRLSEMFNVTVDYLIGNESEQQKKPIEANVPDELLNSPIKLEALSVFSSLSAEDQQLFIELMRSRGKQ